MTVFRTSGDNPARPFHGLAPELVPLVGPVQLTGPLGIPAGELAFNGIAAAWMQPVPEMVSPGPGEAMLSGTVASWEIPQPVEIGVIPTVWQVSVRKPALVFKFAVHGGQARVA